MPVYEPASPELGKNATAPRVNALREMNKAGGPQFKRYERGGSPSGPPSYQIVTLAGETRDLQTREVPAYIVGQVDGYSGFLSQLHEAIDAALSDPDVSDRETLVGQVVSGMEERCGEHLRRAASFFIASEKPSVNSVVA